MVREPSGNRGPLSVAIPGPQLRHVHPGNKHLAGSALMEVTAFPGQGRMGVPTACYRVTAASASIAAAAAAVPLLCPQDPSTATQCLSSRPSTFVHSDAKERDIFR